MSADSVVGIAWDILKSCLVVPIGRGFRYVMSSKSFADRLRNEVHNLENEARRVKDLEQVAENNLRILNGPFTDWRENANKALEEAQNLLDAFDQASKTCCYGTLPDPYCRYRFSTKAEAEIMAVQKIAQICIRFRAWDDICLIGPAPADRNSGLTFESRNLMIQEIMEALASKRNSAVGVYGMGGLGKSTLLDEVETMLREKKSFDWVAKADVSENPDIDAIQDAIANALEFARIKEEKTPNERAKLLRQRLENEERNNKKVLIILDNLWKGLDLKSVGIPCGPDNKVKGCQLLLSSRDRHVLRVEMGCDEAFQLYGLEKAEAKRLFERIGGDRVHEDDFEALVDKALDKCAGVPFLIVDLAKRFKDADLPQWKDTVKRIEELNYDDINELIDRMLLWSYDKLKVEVKRFLRLCVAYGVSKPSLQNLVNYGFGLGIFEGVDSMEDMRNRLSSHIRTLQASSLLLDSEDVASLKIHDLVREFVVSKASSNHPFLVLKDNKKGVIELPKDKLKSCTAVCFPYVDIKEQLEELDCPDMQIFLLFTNNSLEVSDSYFNSMRKLMVLHLSKVYLTRSHSPFQSLEKLHTLCLDDCLLEDVAVIGELKWLRILSFVNSKIERLPKEVGQLVELRLLDLSHCSRLETIDPGVLGSLINLEELFMEDSFHQWNATGQTPPTNAGLIELNNMKNLCTLYASISDLSMLPEDLNVEKLTKYKIHIGDVYHQSYFEGSSTLECKWDPTTSIHQKGCIQTLLGKTDNLFFDGLNGIEQSICMLSQEGFPKLKHLHVKNSPSIHYVLQSPSQVYFKTMESLLLENLINLDKICNNHISSMSFSALKVVRVNHCNKMEVLFPLSLLRELPQLEEIEIASCQLMREIVDVDDCSRVELRNLHVLKFVGLPNTKNFSTATTAPSSSTSNDQVDTQVAFFNGQQVSIPSLDSLIMDGLPNLDDIFTEESPVGRSNLQYLKVSSCKSLSTVIHTTSLVKLHKLQTLIVEYCDSMQEIFCLGEQGAGVNVETPVELNTISIKGLPSLTRIWSKNPCGIMRFHNLEELEVDSCDNLEFLFFPSMVQSLAQLRQLKVHNCKKMEAIIMEEEGSEIEISETLVFSTLTDLTIQDMKSLTCFFRTKCSLEVQGKDRIKSCSTTLFNQEVSIPSLESLTMKGLPNLEDIFAKDFPMGQSNLQFLEVSFCESLSTVIHSTSLIKLRKLQTLRVEHCNSLQEIFCLDELGADANIETLVELKTINIVRLPRLRRIWSKNPRGILRFHNLEELEVDRCDNLEFLFFPSMVQSLIQLRKLRTWNCKKMEAIIMEEEGSGIETTETLVFSMLTNLTIEKLESLTCFSRTKCSREAWDEDRVKSCSTILFNQEVAFPSLETLYISYMDNIEILWDNQVAANSFHKLKSLGVEECKKLINIIPYCILGQLRSLENLAVQSCGSLEVVFKLQPLSPPDGDSVARFSLKKLELVDLPKLERVWDKEFHSRVKFLCLRSITLFKCESLTALFPTSVAIHLTQLEELRISNCKMLTEVIADWEGEEGLVVAFNLLKYMQLDELIELRCFGSIRYTLKFPLLEDVIVSTCPNMKFFSKGLIEAPKLLRVQVSTKSWFWKENLNITIQNMFEEMATMSQVQSMRLS